MNLDEYKERVKFYWANQGLTCAVLGLTGEAGEVADLHKKHMWHRVPTTTENYALEIGDVLFYVLAAANELMIPIETIMQMNVDKLAKRYPGGFVQGGGVRDTIQMPDGSYNIRPDAGVHGGDL